MGLDAHVFDRLALAGLRSSSGGLRPGWPGRRRRRHALGPRSRPPAPRPFWCRLGPAAANGTARRRPLVPALRAGSHAQPEGSANKNPELQVEHGGEGSIPRGRASAPSGRHGCSGGFATGAAVRGGEPSPKSSPSGRTRATPMPSKQAERQAASRPEPPCPQTAAGRG